MNLDTITVDNFKDQFFRDFAYLPVWNDEKTYKENAIVYYTDENFYKCLQNGTTELPTDPTKWVLVSEEYYNYVLDEDIEKAFVEAQIVFNQGLFGTDAQITLAYLYLTAHYLVNDLRTSQQGLGSSAEFSVNNRSVGSVSEAYAIPQAYLDSPLLNFYTKTGYGLKYLSLVLPNIVGNVVSVYGGTNP